MSENHKTEIITKKDIQKYLNLIYDTPQAHRPNELCIFLVNIDKKNEEVTKADNKKAFGKDFADLIDDKLSPENFFKQIANYKKFIEIPKT